MATRVRLTADVDPEVKKRVRIAAIESETSVSEWIERALMRELERAPRPAQAVDEREVYRAGPGNRLQIPDDPIKLRGSVTMAETVLEDRGER